VREPFLRLRLGTTFEEATTLNAIREGWPARVSYTDPQRSAAPR
jgi:hypothetical protein